MKGSMEVRALQGGWLLYGVCVLRKLFLRWSCNGQPTKVCLVVRYDPRPIEVNGL